MADVRPDEVTAILREQLSNFKTEAELEEVGTVLQVGDGVALFSTMAMSSWPIFKIS